MCYKIIIFLGIAFHGLCGMKKYHEFKSSEDFFADTFLKDKEWDDIKGTVRKKIVDDEKVRKIFFENPVARVKSTDYWVGKWVSDKFFKKDGAAEKIKKREKSEKLPEGSFEKIVIECSLSRKKHKIYYGVIKTFCKDSKIELLGGSSCYLIKVGDYIVYIPRTLFCSIENGFNPYNYQMLSRIFSQKQYKHFKDIFGFTHFSVRIFKIVSLDGKLLEKDSFSDKDVVLVSKYKHKDTILEIFDGGKAHKLLSSFFHKALGGNKVDAKILRDLVLGFYWCGVWDMARGNVFLEKEDHFFVSDAEAPGCGGSAYHYRDKGGQPKISSPWMYLNKKKMARLGTLGLEFLSSLVLGKGDLKVKAFKNMMVSFAQDKDVSPESLIKYLQRFNKNNDDILSKKTK